MQEPERPEPLHRCTARCSFYTQSRRCKNSGNIHRCDRECVITDAEGNYVCSLLGLVLKDFSLPRSPERVHRKRSQPRHRSQRPWIREALECFLATDRTELIQSAQRRVTAKIRKHLSQTSPSLRGSLVAFQSVLGNASAQRSMNFPLPLSLRDGVIDDLAAAFNEYWGRVGSKAFTMTRQSVYTYVAVMIENLAEGVFDSHGAAVVPCSELIRLHCPNTVRAAVHMCVPVARCC